MSLERDLELGTDEVSHRFSANLFPNGTHWVVNQPLCRVIKSVDYYGILTWAMAFYFLLSRIKMHASLNNFT